MPNRVGGVRRMALRPCVKFLQNWTTNTCDTHPPSGRIGSHPTHPRCFHPPALEERLMRRIAYLVGVVVVLGVYALVSSAAADVFGSGENEFEIKFVHIGSPGNPPDANPNPAGAVPYRYRIGKYEISEQMIDKANAEGTLGLTIDAR